MKVVVGGGGGVGIIDKSLITSGTKSGRSRVIIKYMRGIGNPNITFHNFVY